MKLTLCAIARNEEALLGGMLASVQGVVDQVILVDTGSTDRSVEIAEKAGATVLKQDWGDDFSAPRNLAVQQLSDGWVLVLDADERLADGVGSILRSVLTSQDVDYALLPLHNARTLDASPSEILSGEARQGAPVLLARLFRWTPELRWEGVIHESPRLWLSGRRGVTLEAPILHYGYVEESRIRKAASDRNLPLLRENCRRNPEEPLPWTYLARELEMLGRTMEAAEALERAWSLLPARLSLPSPPPLISLPTLRAQAQLARGEADAALSTLEEAQRLISRHSNLLWLEGRCCLWKALQPGETTPHLWLQRAESCLAEVQARGEQVLANPLVEGVGGSRSAEDLAVVRLMSGDARGALAVAPPTPAGQLCRWEAEILLGNAATIIVSLPRSGSDALLLTAMAADQLGALPQAEAPIRQALRQGGWLSAHRQLLAQHLLTKALFLAGRATAGPGPYGRMAAMSLGKNPLDGPELPAEAVQLAVRSLLAQEKLEALERLLTALRGEPYTIAVQTLEALGLSWEPNDEEA